MERSLRPASEDTLRLVQAAVGAILRKHAEANFGDGMIPELDAAVEELLGPFDKKQVEAFGVQFTKLQAESDGYHEYVILYF